VVHCGHDFWRSEGLMSNLVNVGLPRVAIVGAAGWAGTRHVAAFSQLGAQLSGVVDPNPALESMAARYAVPRFGSVDDLHEGEHDIVVVSLPSRSQPAICRGLLARGFHVLSEKPIAPRRADAAALLDGGVPTERLMVAFLLRYHPAVEYLRSWLSAQGRVILISVRSVARKEELGSWRLDPSQGGVVSINGIHALELVPSLVGEPASVVHAAGGDHIYRQGVDDHVIATMEFPGGASFRLETSWAPWGIADALQDGDWDLSLDIVTTTGRAVWANWHLRHWDRTGESVSVSWTPRDLFVAQAAACVRFFRGETPAVGLNAALAATDLAEAITNHLAGSR
jgi:predicted dehydrogenase